MSFRLSSGGKWPTWFSPFTLAFLIPLLFLTAFIFTGWNPLHINFAIDGVLFLLLLITGLVSLLVAVIWYLRIRFF